MQGVLKVAQGSSPRVRGTPPWSQPIHGRAGIIPACAGNTQTRQTRHPKQWDHPRVCGEHLAVPSLSMTSPGSSPRVRGTPWPSCRVDSHAGIIPACAGNTPTATSNSPGSRDHPRVCGEHYDGAASTIRPLGSSPRVRGTRRRHGSATLVAGDHPRVCGEHHANALTAIRGTGSSPRVRGTQC